MKLIVGLGNPGVKYTNTRHNVGYLLCDTFNDLVKKSSFNIHKSSEFMNNSGLFVAQLLKKNKVDLSDLCIVHDDLDLKLGQYKIQIAKGPKVHNGLNSIEKELGSDQFWRIRVGIDNRTPENRTSGEEYVLQDFTSEEREVINGVLKEICKKLATS